MVVFSLSTVLIVVALAAIFGFGLIAADAAQGWLPTLSIILCIIEILVFGIILFFTIINKQGVGFKIAGSVWTVFSCAVSVAATYFFFSFLTGIAVKSFMGPIVFWMTGFFGGLLLLFVIGALLFVSLYFMDRTLF